MISVEGLEKDFEHLIQSRELFFETPSEFQISLQSELLLNVQNQIIKSRRLSYNLSLQSQDTRDPTLKSASTSR